MVLNFPAKKALPVFKQARFSASLLCLFILFSVKVNAQYNTSNISYGEPRSNFGLSLNTGIDVPLGSLQQLYKPAPYFSAEFLRFKNNFTFSIGFGYRSFTAKQSNYTQTDSTGTSSAGVSNFTSYMLYVGTTYNFNLNRNTLLFIGLNSGYYFTTYGVSASASGGGLDVSISAAQTEKEGYLAPKVGFGFKLSDEVQLNLQAAYNIFFTPSYSYYYSDGTTVTSSGTILQSVSAGASLIYRF